MRNLIVTGRLAADAEKKVSQSGKEYILFRIANDENDDKGQDGKPITHWYRCSSFQSNHINLCKWLTKGKPLLVIGRYRDNIYQNKNTGACEIGRDISVTDISFIDFGNGTQNNTINGQSTVSAPLKAQVIPQVTGTINNATAQPSSARSAAPTTASVENGVDDLPF